MSSDPMTTSPAAVADNAEKGLMLVVLVLVLMGATGMLLMV